MLHGLSTQCYANARLGPRNRFIPPRSKHATSQAIKPFLSSGYICARPLHPGNIQGAPGCEDRWTVVFRAEPFRSRRFGSWSPSALKAMSNSSEEGTQELTTLTTWLLRQVHGSWSPAYNHTTYLSVLVCMLNNVFHHDCRKGQVTWI